MDRKWCVREEPLESHETGRGFWLERMLGSDQRGWQIPEVRRAAEECQPEKGHLP